MLHALEVEPFRSEAEPAMLHALEVDKQAAILGRWTSKPHHAREVDINRFNNPSDLRWDLTMYIVHMVYFSLWIHVAS